MKLPVFILLILLLAVWAKKKEEEKKEKPQHYNIILIGATGDLAQKYLWRGLFDLFAKTYVKDKVSFLIYGCARKTPNEGRKILSEILLNTIKCFDVECREMKKNFVEAIQYHQLKTEAHYKELDSKVSENTKGLYAMLDADWTYEVGRLVYLSIPPSQYPKTIELVHKHLRPRIARNVWMRLVLEKPFGQDLDTAKDLSIALSQHFKEEEIFRIDHYLGKTVVKQILPFR
jgi:hexose-6-phosphate dehydrogenase